MESLKIYEINANYIDYLLPFAPHLFHNSKKAAVPPAVFLFVQKNGTVRRQCRFVISYVMYSNPAGLEIHILVGFLTQLGAEVGVSNSDQVLHALLHGALT